LLLLLLLLLLEGQHWSRTQVCYIYTYNTGFVVEMGIFNKLEENAFCFEKRAGLLVGTGLAFGTEKCQKIIFSYI
jgi:hypothetical protein